jgi:hypothetical protein
MQPEPAASPTGEQVFATWAGIETSSAGLNHDAENHQEGIPVTLPIQTGIFGSLYVRINNNVQQSSDA